MLLALAGAWGTTMISTQVTLDLVEVTVLDGPDDRLADERLLGATAELAGQRLLVPYTDKYGTTYQVKFGEW